MFKILILFITLINFNSPNILIEKINQQNQINSINKRQIKINIFYSINCPMCIKYAPVLRKLIEVYNSDSITFLFIFPNSEFPAVEIFMKQYNFNTNFKIDNNLKISKKYKVEVTPEIVVLNQNDKILYKGAIDDLYYDIGKYRKFTTNNYLKEFIELWRENKTSEETIYKKSFGCFINL